MESSQELAPLSWRVLESSTVHALAMYSNLTRSSRPPNTPPKRRVHLTIWEVTGGCKRDWTSSKHGRPQCLSWGLWRRYLVFPCFGPAAHHGARDVRVTMPALQARRAATVARASDILATTEEAVATQIMMPLISSPAWT